MAKRQLGHDPSSGKTDNGRRLPAGFKRRPTSFRVTCIVLTNGTVLTERDFSAVENHFKGRPPIVGSVLTVTVKGRKFRAKVIWTDWGDPPRRGAAERIAVEALF